MLDEGAVELLFIWARLEMGKSDTQPAAERTAGYRRAIEALGHGGGHPGDRPLL